MVDHPNAKAVRTRVEIKGGDFLTVVEVETDLPINFGDPDFDRSAFDALTAACVQYFNDHKMAVDRIDVIEKR